MNEYGRFASPLRIERRSSTCSPNTVRTALPVLSYLEVRGP
jgi:hypothetical protein